MAPQLFSPSDEDGPSAPSTQNTSTTQGLPSVTGLNPRIAGWRLEDRGDSDAAAAPLAGFASRLTQQLIRIYTDRGDLVVDLDNDPFLRRVSLHEGRRYAPLTRLSDAAGLDSLPDRIGMVVLSWPTRRHDVAPTQILEMLAACRPAMTADAFAFALFSSAQPGAAGIPFAEHAAVLLPAARRAGLTQTLQIVAVANTGTGDQFRYFATPAEADTARDTAPSAPGRPHHIDVLVFTRKATHHG